MTSLELRAIERYAIARLEAAAAQSDLDAYRPFGVTEAERAAARVTRQAVEDAYKALPLEYQFLLAELAAEEEAEAEAAYNEARGAVIPRVSRFTTPRAEEAPKNPLRFCRYA